MNVLKFGGKSLANGKPLASAIEIIKAEQQQGNIAVVVSARGQSTDNLLEIYTLAAAGQDFTAQLATFIAYQDLAAHGLQLPEVLAELTEILQALQKLKAPSQKTKDRVVSFGEILSAKLVAHVLQNEGLSAEFVDARNLIKVKNDLSGADIDCFLSEKLTLAYFKSLRPGQVPVITGFIASDENNETVTLGRNGSNLTTSLVANFIAAKEVQNWTDVSGVYTASPKYVPHARVIDRLSYKEAYELANFGANILHPKTINPLMAKGIPLKIHNSLEKNGTGTIIDKEGSRRGIKAVSVLEDVALVTLESTEIAGKIGIDGRIFSALGSYDISVRLISQASSEQGIGFVVDAGNAPLAKKVLAKEFKAELAAGSIAGIKVNDRMAIIAVLGRHNYALEKAIYGLRRNKIWLHLISNSISGAHISLVIDNRNLKKAVNVVHSQVFGAIKTLNLFAFGKGTVGGKLLDQIVATSEEITARRNLQINIIGVADSQRAVINPAGLGSNWRAELAESKLANHPDEIMAQLADLALENIVIADNTSSQTLADNYVTMLTHGFDIVASNKKANSGSYAGYKAIRDTLQRKGRLFLYETNVGAGLPLIDTIRHLQDSADKVERIRGVFSGSLSYIFNNFSVGEVPFSQVLAAAREQGLTEPDPREDLNGLDVARKLIILARELGLAVELAEVEVENLIPEELHAEADFTAFMDKRDTLDNHYAQIKASLKAEEVLRYVGDLDIPGKNLTVSLVKVPAESPLGGVKNADTLFEIYTTGYGGQPIVIQGAGAGGEVTARGVYSDLLRIGEKF